MWVGIGALVVTIYLLAKRDFRKSYGWIAVASLLLFLVQAILGRETVTQLLKAEIVTAHLIGGYSLFAVNLWLAWKMKRQRSPAEDVLQPSPWLMPVLWGLLFILFVQTILGGVVSSHYAGLACQGFPQCNGEWWPQFAGAVGLHYMHRLGAYVVILAFGVFAPLIYRKHKNSLLRVLMLVALVLVFFQLSLGIGMIYTQVASSLSVLHSLTALCLFTTLLLSIFHVRYR